MRRQEEVRIEAAGLGFECTSAARLAWTAEEDRGVLELRVVPDRTAVVRVAWRVPCVGATACWAADGGEHRGLPPFWRRPRTAALEKNAPVGCLVGAQDQALCTFAAGEVVRPV